MATTTRQDKIRATIERLKARAEKFKSGAYDKKYQKNFPDDGRTHYRAEYDPNARDQFSCYKFTKKECANWEAWRDMDYCQLLYQIRTNEEKLGEAKRLDDKQDKTTATRAAKAEKKTATLDNLPKPIQEFYDKMMKINMKYMLDRYDYIQKLGYEGCKKADCLRDWRFFGYETEDRIKKMVKDSVDNMVINLMTRIQDKVGTITDARNLRVTRGNQNEGYTINGTVIGDKGTCTVRSISAGGYNIQCWHIRTIIH